VTVKEDNLETGFYEYTMGKLRLYVWLVNYAPFHKMRKAVAIELQTFVHFNRLPKAAIERL
jgi:hypothetical protein